MVSDIQLIANRENAKKGGPKTARGKAIVRLNALKYGLFAADLLLPGDPDDTEELLGIWERLMAELKPQGTLEEMIVLGIISSFWRRQMAIRLEKDYVGEQFVQCMIDCDKGDAQTWSRLVDRELGRKPGWMNLVRYQTTFDNRFYKAIHEFERRHMAGQGTVLPAPLAIDVAVSNDA
jgi:hypothetical protein